MTTTTATPLRVSAAGQYDCTIEDGHHPRPVTITKYLVDERVTVFDPDGWNYRVAVIEVGTDGIVWVGLTRQTRRGHRDYRNGFGFSLTLDDFATGPTSSPQFLAGLVARIRATVDTLAPTAEESMLPADADIDPECNDDGQPVGTVLETESVEARELVEGDVFSIDGATWHVCAVNMTWGGTVSVYLYPNRRRTDRSPCVRVACGEPTRVLRVTR